MVFHHCLLIFNYTLYKFVCIRYMCIIINANKHILNKFFPNKWMYVYTWLTLWPKCYSPLNWPRWALAWLSKLYYMHGFNPIKNTTSMSLVFSTYFHFFIHWLEPISTRLMVRISATLMQWSIPLEQYDLVIRFASARWRARIIQFEVIRAADWNRGTQLRPLACALHICM